MPPTAPIPDRSRERAPRRRAGRLLVALVVAAAVPGLSATGPALAAPTAPVASAPAAPVAPAASGAGAVTDDRTPGVAPAPGPTVAAASSASTAAGHDAPAGGSVVAAETGIAPFELLGVTLPRAADPVLVRVRQGGRWSAWHELGFEGDATGDDRGGARPGAHSAPLWVGPSDGYEVLLPPGSGEPTVHVVRATAAPAGGVQAAAAPVTAAATAAEPYASSPGVLSRAAWGARPMRGAPSEAADLRLAIVHHSVSVNGYSAAAVPGMLRSIQAYHMDAHGWSDVGYNFAVDRFGRIWELRAGGILNAVIGGHSQGFNTGSVGVVLLGDHSTVAPPTAATNAVAEIIAWRFAVAQTDPRGLVDFRTVSGSTKFPPGTVVRINAVSAHRDVGSTACPGAVAYGAMNAIRARVASRYAALAGTTLTRWLSSGTRRYTDLRGTALGAPDIAAPDESQLDVVARGSDGQLYVSRWRGAGFSAWSGLGGSLTSTPSVVSPEQGRTEVFALGTDRAVWYRSYRDGAWSPWGTIGGNLTTAPEVSAYDDGSLLLVGRGTDGATWARTRSVDGTWSSWRSLGGGIRAGATPAVATDVGGAAGGTVVVVTGGDGAAWARRGRVDQPSRWERVGGSLTSGLTAATDDAGPASIIGRGGDGRLWTVRLVDGRWSAWRTVSRERVGEGAGLTSWGPGRLDLATVSPDGRIFHHWQGDGVTW